MTTRAHTTTTHWRARARCLRLVRTGLTILVGASLASPTAAAGPEIETRLVVPEGVTAGTQVVIDIEMALGPGWHVNSHEPTYPYLIPTVVTLSSAAGAVSAVRYPEAVKRRFEFADGPLSVYEGTVHFLSDLSVPATAAGPIAVEGVAFYQACNERQCFAPREVALSATVVVGGASE